MQKSYTNNIVALAVQPLSLPLSSRRVAGSMSYNRTGVILAKEQTTPLLQKTLELFAEMLAIVATNDRVGLFR